MGRCNRLSPVDAQRGSGHAIRPDVLGILDRHEVSQPGAGAVDPALDRANRNTADRRRLFVTEPFGSDQEHRLPLLDWKLGESTSEILKVQTATLLGRTGEPKQQFGGWPTDGGFARC
jgi:hypothetical protein